MKKYWTYNGRSEEILSYSDMIIGHIVPWLLDTLSNDYWTHRPMTIGHIVQRLIGQIVQYIYRTEFKVSKECPFTHYSWIWIGLKKHYIMILHDENYAFCVTFKKNRTYTVGHMSAISQPIVSHISATYQPRATFRPTFGHTSATAQPQNIHMLAK